jgi:NRPS condensation-like uncharacterized protein
MPEGGENMASRARKNTTPRAWTEETPFTKRIAARIPLDLNDRLKAYVEGSMYTITDVVIEALKEHLTKRGY